MQGEHCVVGLNHTVRDLGRRKDGERGRHSSCVFISDLEQYQGSQSRPGAAANGLCYLEALWTVARFRLAPDYIHNFIHQFCSFRVMPLGPGPSRAFKVSSQSMDMYKPEIASSRSTEAHIAGLEQRSHRRSADHICSAGLQVD